MKSTDKSKNQDDAQSFLPIAWRRKQGTWNKMYDCKEKTTDSNNWYNYLGKLKVNSFSSKEKKMITFISVLLFLVDLNNRENIL